LLTSLSSLHDINKPLSTTVCDSPTALPPLRRFQQDIEISSRAKSRGKGSSLIHEVGRWRRPPRGSTMPYGSGILNHDLLQARLWSSATARPWRRTFPQHSEIALQPCNHALYRYSRVLVIVSGLRFRRSIRTGEGDHRASRRRPELSRAAETQKTSNRLIIDINVNGCVCQDRRLCLTLTRPLSVLRPRPRSATPAQFQPRLVLE
jgi:hypothetical protein